jgi:hypothetical protein
MMMPNGAQIYGYNMMPTQGLQSMPMPGQMMMPSAHGANPMNPNVVGKPGQPAAQQVGRPNGTRSNMPPLTKSPISSIRPSEITKKQIECLRSSLRYFEDQLQYNKHQIDEKVTEEQAQQIRNQIEHFGKILESQLAFEAHNYPKSESHINGERLDLPKAGNKTAGQVVTVSSTTGQHGSEESIAKNTNVTREKPRTRISSTINPVKSAHSFLRMKSQMSLADVDAELSKKSSSLPAHAAAAKPFTPRTAPSNSSVTTVITNPSTPSPVPALQGSSNWSGFFKNQANAGPGSVYLSNNLARETSKNNGPIYDRESMDDEMHARRKFWVENPFKPPKDLSKFNSKHFHLRCRLGRYSKLTLLTLSQECRRLEVPKWPVRTLS